MLKYVFQLAAYRLPLNNTPMTKHFTATGYLPNGKLVNCAGDTIDFAQLPAFLRVLLTTDGTVTKSLESWFWEAVGVINLGQAYIELCEPAPVIACTAGDSVLQRRVELVGQQSQRRFARADSLIRTAILPASVRANLEAGLVGVGEILRECNLETYREIVDFGYEQPGQQDTVWRTYRIVMEGEPFIQITEYFPVAIYGHVR